VPRLISIILIALAAVRGLQAQGNPMSRMQAINRDLGVECSHCHVGDDWKRDEKPQFGFAGRMIKMTAGLSSGTLRDLGGVTCWTCHRGKVKPDRMPRASWEGRLANWPEALKLKDDEAKKPAQEVYRNIQSLKDSPAGGLPMTMSVFAAALGVSCDHCHVPGRWDSDAKPAKATARLMLRLFSEIPTYFEASRQPSMQCYTCHQGAAKPQHGIQ
jgi:Photosynthetic reaction centre cytochrome C subunit